MNEQAEIPRDERAYHEAGHVVLFLEFDRTFRDVSVVARQESSDDTAPSVWSKEFRDERKAGGDPDSIKTKQVMLILLAGMAAERIWLNQIDRPFSPEEMGSSDYRFLEWFYERVNRVTENTKSSFHHKVPGQDEHFYHMLKIAQRILKQRLWRRVQAVANKLMTRDVLTYDEVKEIVGQTDG